MDLHAAAPPDGVDPLRDGHTTKIAIEQLGRLAAEHEDTVRRRFLTVAAWVALIVAGLASVATFVEGGTARRMVAFLAAIASSTLVPITVLMRRNKPFRERDAIALVASSGAAIFVTAWICETPSSALNLTHLLFVVVIAAGFVVRPAASLVVGVAGLALAFGTFAVLAWRLPHAHGLATLELWRSTVALTLAGTMGWFISTQMQGLVERLRDNNREIRTRAEHSAVLAGLGRTAATSHDVEAFMAEVARALQVSLDAGTVAVIRADAEGRATLHMGFDLTHDPADATRTLAPRAWSAVLESLASEDSTRVPPATARDVLGADHAVAVALRWPPGRGAIAVARDGRAFASHEMSFFRTATRMLSAVMLRAWHDAELRRTEAQLADMVRKSPDGILSVNSTKVVEVFNPAAMLITGYPERDVIGRSVGNLPFLSPEDNTRLAAAMDQLLVDNRPVSLEFEITRRDQQGRSVDVSALLVTRKDGLPAIYATMRDVTERRVLEHQLRQAQRLETVGRLAGGVAHDFNNVLSVILADVDGLLAIPRAGAQDLELIHEIREAARRAAGLTRQLLAFSRQQVLQPRHVMVDEVLANLDRILRRTIGEDIELTLDLRATDGAILADPTQIEQIAMNLAVNARAAMPRGGQLAIETKCVRHASGSAPHENLPTGDYVQICVEDSGVGMGPETLGRIFEPFFTRKKAGEGTGLGLATVHAIVMQTNGSVAVTSARGRGARFEILLPRSDPPAGVVVPQAPEPTALPRAHATVLLVEDELTVRNATRRMLERAGYRTLSAVCGEEALKVAHESKRPIDLVLTDVVMPGMGGAALAEAVRREWPNTPIVFVSGYTGGGGATDLPLDARTRFVAKPFDATALCRAIEEAIAAQKAS